MEILNRKANYNYEVIETVECGIVLKGTEIKSIRLGNANIKDSYGIIKNGECYLLNMHISSYDKGNIFNHEETRTRKLLLHKKEVLKLNNSIVLQGYTLIPLKVYLYHNCVKILLGLCKGKKTYDKKEALKNKDIERDMQKELKNRRI